MKKSAFILFFIFSILTGIFGQKRDIALKEYFLDAEFFLSEEYYPDALHDYIEIYKRGYQNNANINYKIGICYLNLLGQKEKSIEFLLKASLSASSKYKESKLTESYAPIDVFLYLGNSYRVNNMLDKAYDSYKKYKDLLPKDEKTLQEYADKQIEACKIAKEFMQKPLDVSFTNLGPQINSISDESKAVVSGDGSTLVYMHRLPFYDAIYCSKNKNGKWETPENITPQIMSDGDQYVSSVSYDGKMLLLSKENEFNSDIYVSYFANNRWTKSEPLNSEINTKYWESHASISKDGKTLYFTSNRKGGQGNMDIYSSTLKSDGKWGPAKNLGKQINTEFNEDTPFITEDGNTLYFSSQGNINMGGYDVFLSHRMSDTAWSVPENIGYPISTTDDDLFFYPWDNGRVAYISRIDSSGYGGTDIFKVEFHELIKEEITEQAEKPSPDTSLQKIKTVSEPNVSPSIATSGAATIASNNINPETVPDTIKKTPTTSVYAAPSKVKTVNISPVFFDFNKSQLNETGKQELDKLANLMKEYPDLKVLISGFADALGPDDYNLRLSEGRAVGTLKYLVAKGIDASRLKAIGKGETEFLAPNSNKDGSDNPEGRKLNRRVEFEITGINEKLLIIKRLDPIPGDNQIQKK